MRKIDDSVYIADGAQVVDEVVIGKGSSVWYNAVLRGDDNQIIIGERSNIQDNCVVHVGTDNPTIIGDDVSVGHLALLHGCTIGNGTLIGMGSIVMNGAKIGCRCIDCIYCCPFDCCRSCCLRWCHISRLLMAFCHRM